MRVLRRLAKVLAAALILTTALANPSQPPWRTLQQGPARVRYQGLDAAARRALEAARQAAERLGPELGLSPVRPFTVVLHPTHAEFAKAVGIQRRELVVGVAHGEQVAHVDASEHLADLPSTVVHEVAHLLLAQAVQGAPLPRWFEEGYAERAARAVPWASQQRLAANLGTARLLPLETLTDRFPSNEEEARVAYDQSHAFVVYILQHSPVGAMAHLVAGVRAGASFEQAVVAATGQSSAQWFRRWRADFRGRFRWYPWIALGAGLSGVAMAVLCVLAFRNIQRRKSRLVAGPVGRRAGYGAAIRRRRR
ncbi:MAG: hypothetical protein QHJ73_06350 [Armatimonadota bacterium]|nr:hypothetical protein [Armatimonadota bacterium]